MHDDVNVYRQVTAGLPRSERLVFSFKFTRGDFRYGQPYNPVLAADGAEPDGRPKWIEMQCQREFEGKGAFPNFQAGTWAEFFEASGLLTANPAANRPPAQAELRFPLRMPDDAGAGTGAQAGVFVVGLVAGRRDGAAPTCSAKNGWMRMSMRWGGCTVTPGLAARRLGAGVGGKGVRDRRAFAGRRTC